MEKFEGVANTLFVPLVARIAISKEFPEYFKDEKAMELEKYLPENAAKGASQYSNMASVARYYNMDDMVVQFVKAHNQCNIIYPGAGFETAYDRLHNKFTNKDINWFVLDLPKVIEVRQKVFGERKNETLIGGDMFKLNWVNKIDITLPSLIIVSGVFQYFHEEKVVNFIKGCKENFVNGELIFDATSTEGLRFANWFIKRTGNKNAVMYFGVDDSRAFAEKCGAILLEERTFFQTALKILGRRLSLITKISMKVAERKKQAIIVWLKLTHF